MQSAAHPTPDHVAPSDRPRWQRSDGCRLWFYVVVLSLVASVVCFYDQDQRMLRGDEATYATVIENMRHSGDWLHLSYRADEPFDKPPFGLWLTAATYDWFGPGLFRYRFWSGFFAIGCVALTVLLGARLLTPAAGALAGLFLILNNDFVFTHGARAGMLDAPLTFFLLLAVYLFYSPPEQTCGTWRWFGIGLALGTACLIKAFVIGGFFFCMLAGIHLLNRAAPLRRRLIGPVVGGVAALMVAAPWHLEMWRYHGDRFTQRYVGDNILKRAGQAREKHAREPLYYVRSVPRSSWIFGMVWPAAALVALWWRRDGQRLPLLRLTCLALGLVAVMSLSVNKAAWYVYPVFPLFAIALAAVLTGMLPALCSRWPRPLRGASIAGCVLAGSAAVLADGIALLRELHESHAPYPPLALYEANRGKIERGETRIVLFAFPERNDLRRALGFTSIDLYYPPKMPLAARTDCLEELSQLLEDGRPTTVFLPPKLDAAKVIALLAHVGTPTLAHWRSVNTTYGVLAYHGSLDHLTAAMPRAQADADLSTRNCWLAGLYDAAAR